MFFLEVLDQLSDQLKQLVFFQYALLAFVDQLFGQREHTLIFLF
jgi:hypothetical protein